MLFTCIRSSLIKRIVSRVRSSWYWAIDPPTNCMNKASLRQKDEFFFIFFFLCCCDLRRGTVIYSLCSRWFEIEAHSTDRSWVWEQRQRVYKAWKDQRKMSAWGRWRRKKKGEKWKEEAVKERDSHLPIAGEGEMMGQWVVPTGGTLRA